MRLKFAAAVFAFGSFAGLVFAQGEGSLNVVSFTATGGQVSDGAPQVTSGKAFDFLVRTSRADMSKCDKVFIKREAGDWDKSWPLEAGVVSKGANFLRFRAMVREGEEGVYDVYLCGAAPPSASSLYQVKYSVIKEGQAVGGKGYDDIEKRARSAQATANSALRKVNTLEKELADRRRRENFLTGELERMRNELNDKATNKDLGTVVDQVKAVSQETRNLAGNIQAAQQRLDQVTQNLDQLSQRLGQRMDAAEGSIAKNQGDIEAAKNGTSLMAKNLKDRTVGSKVLWFIPKPVLKDKQVKQIEAVMGNGAMMTPQKQ